MNNTNSLKSRYEIELHETENHLSDLRSRMLDMEQDAEQMLYTTVVPGVWEAHYAQYHSALDEFNGVSAYLTVLNSNIQELAAYSMSISSEMETYQSQMEEIVQTAAETDEIYQER